MSVSVETKRRFRITRLEERIAPGGAFLPKQKQESHKQQSHKQQSHKQQKGY